MKGIYMNEDEVCPTCLRDQVYAMDDEVIELSKLVRSQLFLLVVLSVSVLYLILK